MNGSGVGTPREEEARARKALEGELWADIAVGKVDAYRDAVEARVKAELREMVAMLDNEQDRDVDWFSALARVRLMLDAGGPDAP